MFGKLIQTALKYALSWLARRAAEPTTWIGLALGIFHAIGMSNEDAQRYSQHLVELIVGVVLMLYPEARNQKK